MYLLLVLLWCSVVVRQFRGSNVLGCDSRFGEFNSRFCLHEFPVSALREFPSKRLICFDLLAVKRAKSTKFPVSAGKNGNFAPPAEQAVTQSPDNGADLRCSGPIARLIVGRSRSARCAVVLA
jgi:hypothetical protein